jgi:hypothetical protein
VITEKVKHIKAVQPEPSSTVRMTECLSLNNLRNDKRALALHFRISEPDAVCYISRKVGGKATPAARTAWEACPVRLTTQQEASALEAGFDLLQGVHAKSETLKPSAISNCGSMAM